MSGSPRQLLFHGDVIDLTSELESQVQETNNDDDDVVLICEYSDDRPGLTSTVVPETFQGTNAQRTIPGLQNAVDGNEMLRSMLSDINCAAQECAQPPLSSGKNINKRVVLTSNEVLTFGNQQILQNSKTKEILRNNGNVVLLLNQSHDASKSTGDNLLPKQNPASSNVAQQVQVQASVIQKKPKLVANIINMSTGAQHQVNVGQVGSKATAHNINQQIKTYTRRTNNTVTQHSTVGFRCTESEVNGIANDDVIMVSDQSEVSNSKETRPGRSTRPTDDRTKVHNSAKSVKLVSLPPQLRVVNGLGQPLNISKAHMTLFSKPGALNALKNSQVNTFHQVGPAAVNSVVTVQKGIEEPVQKPPTHNQDILGFMNRSANVVQIQRFTTVTANHQQPNASLADKEVVLPTKISPRSKNSNGTPISEEVQNRLANYINIDVQGESFNNDLDATTIVKKVNGQPMCFFVYPLEKQKEVQITPDGTETTNATALLVPDDQFVKPKDNAIQSTAHVNFVDIQKILERGKKPDLKERCECAVLKKKTLYTKGFTKREMKKPMCIKYLQTIIKANEKQIQQLHNSVSRYDSNFVACGRTMNEFLPENIKTEAEDCDEVTIEYNNLEDQLRDCIYNGQTMPVITSVISRVNEEVLEMKTQQTSPSKRKKTMDVQPDFTKPEEALKLIKKGLELIQSWSQDKLNKKRKSTPSPAKIKGRPKRQRKVTEKLKEHTEVQKSKDLDKQEPTRSPKKKGRKKKDEKQEKEVPVPKGNLGRTDKKGKTENVKRGRKKGSKADRNAEDDDDLLVVKRVDFFNDNNAPVKIDRRLKKYRNLK